MDKRECNVRGILAGQAPKDAPVTVKGWVRTRRDSKAGISFVHLSDGSSFHPVQVVAPNTLPNYTDEVLKLTAGCAVEATGAVVPSPAKGQPFEMQASAIKVIGWVDDPDTYPIHPKHHTMEFLRGFVLRGNAISFQIQISTLAEGQGLVAREIDSRDVPRANLVLGQLRGRNLPVPSAVFAEQLTRVLEAMRPKPAAAAAR